MKPVRPDDTLQQIGLRLRAARLALGFDRVEPFANAIGASETTVGNWERGDRLADVLVMARLFDRFGITLEWIYNGALRGMDRELQDALEAAAGELGAVVGGTTARWPMQDDGRAVRPAAVPPRKPRERRGLHQPQQAVIK